MLHERTATADDAPRRARRAVSSGQYWVASMRGQGVQGGSIADGRDEVGVASEDVDPTYSKLIRKASAHRCPA